MTAVSTPVAVPLGNGTSRSPGWWAMVWTIATEGFLFVYFLFSYFYLASQAPGPWPPTGPLDLTLMIPATAVLLASSVAYQWAVRGIEQNNQTRLRLGLLLTFALGVAFLVFEWLDWRSEPFTPQSNAFGSLFYTITGFHGAHVIVGLLLNLAVQAWAWRGDFTRERHLAVTNAGMYWHFVDVVWVFVFTTFYLTPR